MRNAMGSWESANSVCIDVEVFESGSSLSRIYHVPPYSDVGSGVRVRVPLRLARPRIAGTESSIVLEPIYTAVALPPRRSRCCQPAQQDSPDAECVSDEVTRCTMCSRSLTQPTSLFASTFQAPTVGGGRRWLQRSGTLSGGGIKFEAYFFCLLILSCSPPKVERGQ